MNTKKSHNLMRRATALLGAIAASSFLGLPVLAGTSPDNVSGLNEQAQNTPGSQLQCVPNSTQSSAPATTATPDASAPGAAQLPNQSDPRTGVSSSSSTVTNETVGATGANSTAGTRMSDSQASNNNSSGTNGDALSQGGATAGGSANERVTTASNQDANSADATGTNNQYSSTRSFGDRSTSRVYGNVLVQGGSTAGGFARQQLDAATNPDATRTSSARFNSNRAAAMVNNDEAAMDSSRSLRSDTLSQSSTQSGQLARTELAQCPPGVTTPNSSTPELRQTPSQPNQDLQTPVQPNDPQGSQVPGNQSPADDNGRTR